MISKRTKHYCRTPELIENYDKAIADNEHVWHCHHRLEKYWTAEQLKAKGIYFDVNPEALILVTAAEHRGLPHAGNQITGIKVRNALRGKKRIFSDEWKNNMRHKKSEEGRLAIKNAHCECKGEKNPMFGKHHSEESKAKMRTARLKRKES